MSKKPIEQLLVEIDNFSRERKVSKKEIAQKLSISYNTFKKWFQKGKGKHRPSPKYVEKIEKFLEFQKERTTYWSDLWMKILRWWETQHQYPTVRKLADEIGWDVQNLSDHFQSKEIPPRLVVEKIAKTIGFETQDLDLILREAQRRTEKVKHLLLVLEEELGWFRDTSKEARDIFREKLDFGDIGYISSLLTMLGDEDKFKRWLTLTTNRFNFFKEKGDRNEEGSN